MAPTVLTATSVRASHQPSRPTPTSRPSRLRTGLAAVASASLIGLLLVGSPAGASTTAVTSTADGGAGSLREAITLANANPGPDTITVPPGLYTRTIAGSDEDLNATGDLDVLDDLTIVGTGGAAVTTIDAAGLDGVFELHGGDITLQGLTLTGADVPPLTTGAGILQRNGATLHLLDSVVAGNHGYSGAGLYAGSALTDVRRTEFVDNVALSQPGNGSTGGAIFKSGGTMTVADSTFAGNEAVAGNAGAVYVQGLTTITNSTFAGNEASRSVLVAEAGTNTTTVLTLQHVTIAGNVATGNAGNAGVLTNAVQNGTSTVALRGVLFHQNLEAGQPKNCMIQNAGTFTSAGHNLSDDTTCAALNQVGDLVDDQQTTLAALATNGGATRTRALVTGSSAIDAAGACTALVPTDQRGAARPAGPACDIGAFELGAVVPPTTTTTTSTTTSTTAPTTTSTTPATTTTTEPTTTSTSTSTLPPSTTTTTDPTSTTTSSTSTSSTSTSSTSTSSTSTSSTSTSSTSTTAPATTTTTGPTPFVTIGGATAEKVFVASTSARGTLPVTGGDVRLALVALLLVSGGGIVLLGARRVAGERLDGHLTAQRPSPR